MRDKGVMLAQANVLTQARYDFSKIEKRAIYFIIKEVRKQFIENKGGQKTLFNDLVIRMKTKDLQDSETVLRDVYTALKSLRKKSIWIEDDVRVLEVGFINYFEHTSQDPSLEIEVSRKILPYLVELAEQFTTYSLTVAIALRTKYSQRFYEHCSQHKNSGFFYMSIEELRTRFMVEDKYSRYALLKSRVIDPAHKELEELFKQGQCDLYFNYSEDRDGRTVKGLKIAVVTKEEVDKKNQLGPNEHLFYIRLWLGTWLNVTQRPKNKVWVDNALTQLARSPEKLKLLYDRLMRMQKTDKEANFAAYARHIIEDDFLD